MKENLSKILFITGLALFSAWVCSDLRKYRLGPDLAGGTTLVYERVKDPNSTTAVDLNAVLVPLKERLDPAGLYNYVIRKLGNDRIEIIMPKSGDAERVRRLVSTVGDLQFKVVANRKRHSGMFEDAERHKGLGKLPDGLGTFIEYGVWRPINLNSKSNKEIVAKAEKEWPSKIIDDIHRYIPLTQAKTTELNPQDGKARIPGHQRGKGNKADEWFPASYKTDTTGQTYVLATWDDDGAGVNPDMNLVRTDEAGNRFVLMVNDEYVVSGEYLDPNKIHGDHDESGTPSVAFGFNALGAAKFGKLTGDYLPEENNSFFHHIGAILDGRLRTAPRIISRITDSGRITGQFTESDVEELVKILRAGRLPVALQKEPSSVYEINPQLGADTIKRGAYSLIGSLIFVMVFMVAYYRFAGLVAVVGLILNLLFTVALMVLFKATWTMPGLAGLILTIGMSVDANVLIYERIREELERGASLAAAIRNGYDKVFTTILDSNLTTILTAVILYMIGTDLIKGFAVTLILGIGTSMFCAMTVSRVIFDVFYSERWLTKLNMAKFMSAPNYDFLRVTKACVMGSIIVLGIGLLSMAVRGKENFDIEFTGGTMLAVKLKEPTDTAVVRDLAGKALANPQIDGYMHQGETQRNVRFIIRSTDKDDDAEANTPKIRQRIAAAFGDKLDLPKVTVGSVAKLEADGKEKRSPGMAGFVGGETATIEFSSVQTEERVRSILTEVFKEKNPSVDNIGALFHTEPTDAAAGATTHTKFQVAAQTGLQAALDEVKSRLESTPQFEMFTQFGSVVAGEMQTRALYAIAFSWLGIIIYVALRFGNLAFGVAGVVALVHDVLMGAGITCLAALIASKVPGLEFIISDMKVDLNVIAALLTLIGFSINDTIVIFDRIREMRGKGTKITPQLVNDSLNVTFSRTIITTLTVFITTTVLYFGGGPTIMSFTFVMIVGLISGTYSTIYIASPVLLWMLDWQERRRLAAGHKPVAKPAGV